MEQAMTDTTDLQEFDITCEAYREYDFEGRVYRIYDPQKLVIREGGTTHRVVDAKGVVHCVPAPGAGGCVLRWRNREGEKAVNF